MYGRNLSQDDWPELHPDSRGQEGCGHVFSRQVLQLLLLRSQLIDRARGLPSGPSFRVAALIEGWGVRFLRGKGVRCLRPRTLAGEEDVPLAAGSGSGLFGEQGFCSRAQVYAKEVALWQAGVDVFQLTFKTIRADTLFFPNSMIAEGRNYLYAAASYVELQMGLLGAVSDQLSPLWWVRT